MEMNLFVDESVDRQIVDRLRQEGYEVAYVAELSPSVTDDEVLREANNRNAILVTADKISENSYSARTESTEGVFCCVSLASRR